MPAGHRLSMLYSIRMRAAEGGAHEKGGRHISGAERLVTREELEATAAAFIARALHHSKGDADFIRITVDAVPPSAIRTVPCLTVAEDPHCRRPASVADAYERAGQLITEHTLVTPTAFRRALYDLRHMSIPMRGAMLVDALTGERRDPWGDRGVRVSRMSFGDEAEAVRRLNAAGYEGVHLTEALVLASKVISAAGIVGELCVSDDPEYTTGYVSYGHTYHRLTAMKDAGDPWGGRLFFIRPDADIDALKTYLEDTVTLIDVPNLTRKGASHESL